MDAREQYMTTREVAERLNVHPTTVSAYILRGNVVDGRTVRLAGIKVGRYYRIPPEALERFIEECRPGAPVPTPAPSAERKRAQEAHERVRRLCGKSSDPAMQEVYRLRTEKARATKERRRQATRASNRAALGLPPEPQKPATDPPAD